MRFICYFCLLLISFSLQAQFLRKKKKKTIKYENIIISDSATEHLSKAIQFETVSKTDSLFFYTEEFQKFKAFLKESYPLVFKNCTEIKLNSNAILLKWEGTNTNLKPNLFMAHQDVVPAKQQAHEWRFPPFGGIINEGRIYGRGTLDDKSSLIGLLEATEYVLKFNYEPLRTTYFAFGDDEETDGNGAKEIANWFLSNKIEFEMILDEGPGIGQDIIPEVGKPISFIGIAEKGYATATLTVTQESGHSSMPSKHTAIGILSQAIANIENKPFKAHYHGLAKKMFDEIASDMKFSHRLVFRNSWLFSGLIKKELSKKYSTNAFIRTTAATTIFNSGDSENVLPHKASATINFRLIPGDSIKDLVPYLNKVINNPKVNVTLKENAYNASPVAKKKSIGYKAIAKSCQELFPEALVAPVLVIGSTDSRHFNLTCKNILRFIPLRFNASDLEKVHGVDESVAISNYQNMIRFYIRLFQNLNEIDLK
ncbi:M20/M25/M40 family metallo-hydrolase [Flavobacterium sp. TSSA_36]|jgi:carboxypeptidase PM20D1|uniref:M20/M25/M40 family metallo-hydrolase n=1 Tax=Flavobacterium sp. TSSA_36 TaxID=3447669 RepID=UPI003F35A642